MKNPSIVFNSPGFKELLNTDEIHKVVEEVSHHIADQANSNYGGDGFQVTTQIGGYGGGRWIGFVTATDKDSLKAESEESALTRALS